MKNSKQRNTNLISRSAPVPSPGVSKVKTDGRIGLATPASYLKGGLTVDNNKSQQPHGGQLGGAAGDHMSPSHEGGSHWQPRVAKSRAMAAAGRAAKKRPHTEPINAQGGSLHRVKPN